MNVYQITQVSAYAADRLHTEATGIVHSVYEKVVNIQLPRGMVCLQAQQTISGPLSLMTQIPPAVFSTLGIQPHTLVEVLPNYLSFSNGRKIFFAQANKKDHTLFPAWCRTNLTQLGSVLELVLKNCDSKGFPSLLRQEQQDDLLLEVAARIINRTVTLLRYRLWDEAAAQLLMLLGLGIGLTPSGDDFLCGVLAGAILSGRQSHYFFRCLRTGLTGALMRTNEISAAFLQAALDKQFSEPVLALVREMPREQTVAAAFSRIGHSSGFDTLCGIHFCLRETARLTQDNY